MGQDAEPGDVSVAPMTDPTHHALDRARARVEAFRVLGVDVPALATRLARAEAAAAAGETEAAGDLCDEIGVLVGLVRREVTRALGAGSRAAGTSAAALASTAARSPEPNRPDLGPEIDRRIGDALATARERWAQAAVADAVAAVGATIDERLAAAKAELAAAAAARPARGPGSDAEDKARFAALRALLDERLAKAAPGLTLEAVRQEIATAIEARRPEGAPAATPASDESVASLAASAAFKELLEERFSVMLRYLKDEVIPKELRRREG